MTPQQTQRARAAERRLHEASEHIQAVRPDLAPEIAYLLHGLAWLVESARTPDARDRREIDDDAADMIRTGAERLRGQIVRVP